MTIKGVDFDLLDTRTYADGHPHEAYDVLRAECPLYRHPGTDRQPAFWVLTRYDDIRKVSLDETNFTTTKGFRIATDNRASMDPEIGRIVSRFMLAMDNPEHNAFRSLVLPEFSPSALAAIEPRIQQAVDDLLAGLRGRRAVEFVTEVGAIVPIKTICTIMGVPAQDEWRVIEFTNAVFGTDDPEFAPSRETANQRYLDIFEYGWSLLEARRKNPRGDLLSRIAMGKIDGRPLDADEQKSYFSNLIAAGNETTRSSLAGALWALWRFPDQRQRLLNKPELIPEAVHELLRWFSPVYQMARTVKHDVEIGGMVLREGERAAMLYGSANHDPTVFTDPHVLDIKRENANRHLAFGYGIHHCLGARLAVMQLRIILEKFLKAFPNYRVTSEPEYIKSNFVGAMKRLSIDLEG